MQFRAKDAQEAEDLRALPVFCVTSDAGPDTQAALQYCQWKLQLRMVAFYEPRHRLARELENSSNHIPGLRAALVVAEQVLNFTRGPWQNCRWFRLPGYRIT